MCRRALWRVKPAGVDGLEGNTPSGVEHRAHRQNSDEHIYFLDFSFGSLRRANKKMRIFLFSDFFLIVRTQDRTLTRRLLSRPTDRVTNSALGEPLLSQ